MQHTLNAKLMNDKLKQGWTTTEFATYLGISIEQFLDVLKKEFTRNAYEGFRNSLRKNDKHQKRIAKNVAQTLSKIPEASTKDSNQEIPEGDGENAPIEDIIDSDAEINTETIDSEENLSSTTESIEELEAKCQQSIELLNNLELQHKGVVSERIQIRNEISDHQKEFEKMLAEVIKRQQAIEELQQQFTSVGETMDEITSKIRDTKLTIAQYTTQIEQAKTVCIYAWNTGVVDIDSSLSLEIPNWQPTFNNIANVDELGALTLNQTRALAKTLTLARFLIAQNTPYEVAIESDISYAYFKKVIS